jgi:hypothetical protein
MLLGGYTKSIANNNLKGYRMKQPYIQLDAEYKSSLWTILVVLSHPYVITELDNQPTLIVVVEFSKQV